MVQAARAAGTKCVRRRATVREQVKRFGRELGAVDEGEKRLSYSYGWHSGFKSDLTSGPTGCMGGRKRQHGGCCTVSR
jgi:hypothetical protein